MMVRRVSWRNGGASSWAFVIRGERMSGFCFWSGCAESILMGFGWYDCVRRIAHFAGKGITHFEGGLCVRNDVVVCYDVVTD